MNTFSYFILFYFFDEFAFGLTIKNEGKVDQCHRFCVLSLSNGTWDASVFYFHQFQTDIAKWAFYRGDGHWPCANMLSARHFYWNFAKKDIFFQPDTQWHKRCEVVQSPFQVMRRWFKWNRCGKWQFMLRAGVVSARTIKIASHANGSVSLRISRITSIALRIQLEGKYLFVCRKASTKRQFRKWKSKLRSAQHIGSKINKSYSIEWFGMHYLGHILVEIEIH